MTQLFCIPCVAGAALLFASTTATAHNPTFVDDKAGFEAAALVPLTVEDFESSNGDDNGVTDQGSPILSSSIATTSFLAGKIAHGLKLEVATSLAAVGPKATTHGGPTDSVFISSTDSCDEIQVTLLDGANAIGFDVITEPATAAEVKVFSPDDMLITTVMVNNGQHFGVVGDEERMGYVTVRAGAAECDVFEGVDNVAFATLGDKALIDLVDEAAGKNCANGGVAVKTGDDLNKNGVLDDSEVKKRRFVCNGVNGVEGREVDGGCATTTPTSPPWTMLILLVPYLWRRQRHTNET